MRGAGEAGGRRDHLSIGGPEELAPLVRSLAAHEANTGSAEVQISGSQVRMAVGHDGLAARLEAVERHRQSLARHAWRVRGARVCVVRGAWCVLGACVRGLRGADTACLARATSACRVAQGVGAGAACVRKCVRGDCTVRGLRGCLRRNQVARLLRGRAASARARPGRVASQQRSSRPWRPPPTALLSPLVYGRRRGGDRGKRILGVHLCLLRTARCRTE